MHDLQSHLWHSLLRNFVDNSVTSTRRPPPSHDAHISASWHTQLQLRAPAVVKREKREYGVLKRLQFGKAGFIFTPGVLSAGPEDGRYAFTLQCFSLVVTTCPALPWQCQLPILLPA